MAVFIRPFLKELFPLLTLNISSQDFGVNFLFLYQI